MLKLCSVKSKTYLFRQGLMIKLMTYKDVRFAVVIFVSTMNSSGLATKGRKNMHTVAAIFNKLFF